MHWKLAYRMNVSIDSTYRYALKGKASGVDPAMMWPTKKELKQLIEDENYYCRSLEFMQEELHLERKRKELEELRKYVQ